MNTTKTMKIFNRVVSLTMVILSSRAMAPQIETIRDYYFGAEIPSLEGILDPIFGCIVCLYAIVAAVLMGINPNNI